MDTKQIHNTEKKTDKQIKKDEERQRKMEEKKELKSWNEMLMRHAKALVTPCSLLILSLFIHSCTKNIPQTTTSICKKVYEFREYYSNLYNGYMGKTDTVFPQPLPGYPNLRQNAICCDSLLTFWENIPEKWIRICDADGETKYYERYVVEIKNIR